MINFDIIIARLIYTLRLNKNIYDAKLNSTDKLQEIRYGDVDNQIYDQPAPFVVVTIPDSPFSTGDDMGSSIPDSDVQTTLLIAVKIIVDNQNSAASEKQLYHFIHEITQSIHANPRLALPDNTDPKSIRAAVIQPLTFENRGKERQIAVITVQYQVGQQSSIKILNYDGSSSSLTLNILDESAGSTAGWETDQLADADGLVDVIPHTYSEQKFLKIELNTDLENDLRNLIKSAVIRNAIIKTATGRNRNCKIFLKNMSPSRVYDEIRMGDIELEITK